MKGVIQKGDYAILGAAGAFVSPASSLKNDASKDFGVAPKEISSQPYSPWGDNNLFPQEVLADLEKNSVALRALDKRKRVHFGRGVMAYREITGADGKTERTPVTDPEVVEFFRVNQINKRWIDLINSLEVFANAWPEFILNKGKDKINKVYIKDPAYCRLAKMDEECKIKFLYYSAQWEYTPSVESDVVVPIPVYDPSKYDGRSYKDGQFVYPVFYRGFNKSYYHLAIWNSVRANKWMDIANKVPVLKSSIMKNQMTIKYHIIIPDDYFSKRYPSPDFTVEQREAKRTEVLDDMNKFLADVENSGKAFVTFAFYSKIKEDYLSGWEIKVIDNKLQDSAYLPDSQAANSEILFAIGVDPCLIGAGTPGGSLGAGSGSDKREAYWMLNADMGPDRQVSLEPLYFIRDFNGWDPDIQFDYIVVDTSQTQNQHPSKINQNVDKNQA
jgi:hypothetical protein